jgi:hypothetical protein
MRTAALALLFGLSACTHTAGGPEYIEFGIAAIEDVGESYPQVCTPVPVMPGARTVHDVPFGGAFSAKVEAERDQVDVTFSGINVPEVANRSIPRAALENGYAETDLRVEALDGRRFTVLLTASCGASTP